MVNVYACPNHENKVGSAASWSSLGKVSCPDSALQAFFGTLGAGMDLCIEVDSRCFSVKGATFWEGLDDVFCIKARSFGECQDHDCCEIEATSAKFEGDI